jgi:single-strand DNA-binding protein
VPADLNRVTLVGRLTRDPELRHTQGGDPVCSIRLAVSSRARDETGNWGDRSNYFDITVFGRQAETASTYLAKGRRIGVDGRLSWREWQAQDGSKRQNVEVIANDVFFLDSRGEGGGGEGASQQGAGWGERQGSEAAPAAAPAPAAVGAATGNGDADGASDDDADVPF